MAKRKIDFTVRDYWNQDSLLLYKEAVSRYPYCAPARLSFLLNLKALNDPDYERELAFTALAVPDRQRLQAEVRAVEQTAAAWRERGDRRMRQAARWAAASATTAAIGRLMSEGGPDTASVSDGAGEAASVAGGKPGREVDFKAVSANVFVKPDEPSKTCFQDGHGEKTCASAAMDTGTALGYENPSEATVVSPDADWADRSRSARRNARRRARRNTRPDAPEVPVPQILDGASEEAPAATISMLWASAPAETTVEAPASAAAASVAPPAPVVVASPVSAAAAAPEPASSRPVRRRPEVFNPWAEVFTPQHTISDWLQADGATSADASEAVVSDAAAVPESASKRGLKGLKAARAAKTPAKATRSQSAAAGKAARAKTKLQAVVPPRPAATPVARTAPNYVDPNELIDRFLRQNDDHILIQVDETRNYDAFDPDQGSLREDWSMGSETLAQLYLKQGSPDKAIEIYRYLSLKFPEKSRYFAGLIREADARKRG